MVEFQDEAFLNDLFLKEIRRWAEFLKMKLDKSDAMILKSRVFLCIYVPGVEENISMF